jgi:hypothetical protein
VFSSKLCVAVDETGVAHKDESPTRPLGRTERLRGRGGEARSSALRRNRIRRHRKPDEWHLRRPKTRLFLATRGESVFEVLQGQLIGNGREIFPPAFEHNYGVMLGENPPSTSTLMNSTVRLARTRSTSLVSGTVKVLTSPSASRSWRCTCCPPWRSGGGGEFGLAREVGEGHGSNVHPRKPAPAPLG